MKWALGSNRFIEVFVGRNMVTLTTVKEKSSHLLPVTVLRYPGGSGPGYLGSRVPGPLTPARLLYPGIGSAFDI